MGCRGGKAPVLMVAKMTFPPPHPPAKLNDLASRQSILWNHSSLLIGQLCWLSLSIPGRAKLTVLITTQGVIIDQCECIPHIPFIQILRHTGLWYRKSALFLLLSLPVSWYRCLCFSEMDSYVEPGDSFQNCDLSNWKITSELRVYSRDPTFHSTYCHSLYATLRAPKQFLNILKGFL